MAEKKPPQVDTIEKLQAYLDKQFGENSLIEFDDELADVEVVSTGIPSLDLALGVGGLPRGRVVEVFGPEGAGKTAVALKTIAWCQANAGRMPRQAHTIRGRATKPISGRCGFIDMEHAFDPSLAKIHNVRMGRGTGFHFTQPSSGVEAMEMAEYMIRSGLFDVIVVDSVAALTTAMELNSNIGDKTIAQIAQLMSESLKKLVPLVNESQVVLMFINQVREKPAVAFGSNETTPGGRALKFYASIRLRVSRGETIMDGTNRAGHQWIANVVKNKVAPPYKKTVVDLYYIDVPRKGKQAGFDTWSDLIETAQKMGVIELSGSQYKYASKETGEILFKANGKVALVEYLAANPDMMEKITIEILGGEAADGDKDSEPEEQE